MSFDPILLEVYRHRFESICEEMGAALERSSFSANIKERRDYSCSLFDGDGRMLAQGDHMPVHLGSMPLSVAAALETGEAGPGDIVFLNDPFRGGTHLPDITAVAPVFLPESDDPVLYVANRAHHADVGGMTAGSMPMSREIYQEGIRIPPVRLVRAGKPVADLWDLLLANVRTPDERRGDLRAQMASVHIGIRRLEELVQARGLVEVLEYGEEIRAYSARRMRAAIAEMPDGRYEFEDFLEWNGGEPGSPPDLLPIRADLRIEGERVHIDFAGSASQIPGPLNANYAITLSACAYALRCAGPTEIPFNSGCFEPLTVDAPEGAIVNARLPAAVCGGNVETSQRIVDVVQGALAQALPERIPAASQGTMNNIALGGTLPAGNGSFTYYETIAGGAGAGPLRPGAAAVHTHMTNTRNTPIEALEHAYPLRVREYHIRRDSGGSGRHPGGDGVVRTLEAATDIELTVLSQRRERGPWGAQGGGAGRPGRNVFLRGETERELEAVTETRMKPGDRLRIETPGGGGWGEPEKGA